MGLSRTGTATNVRGASHLTHLVTGGLARASSNQSASEALSQATPYDKHPRALFIVGTPEVGGIAMNGTP